jgi:hypothetical protein
MNKRQIKFGTHKMRQRTNGKKETTSSIRR